MKKFKNIKGKYSDFKSKGRRIGRLIMKKLE